MQEILPKRKSTRLQGYDYSHAGYYFITICTKDKQAILGQIVGADTSVRPQLIKSEIGKIAENCWHVIERLNENVKTDIFCVMPNHIHGIIIIKDSGGQGRPPLQKIIQSYKSITTRMCFPIGYRQIWQRSYHDHIIRNEADYQRIWQYIDENPVRWINDCYYTK